MGAFMIDAGATILCPHGGQVKVVPSVTKVKLSGMPPLLAADTATVAGCSFNVSGAPSPCLSVQWLMPATRVKVGGRRAAALELDRAVQEPGRRTAGHRDRQRLPDEGAGAVNPARHPYRLTPARRLDEAETDRHIADLVRLVLLTGAGERLHRPEFGAGLGARRCSSRSTRRSTASSRSAPAARCRRRSATGSSCSTWRSRIRASRRSRPRSPTGCVPRARSRRRWCGSMADDAAADRAGRPPPGGAVRSRHHRARPPRRAGPQDRCSAPARRLALPGPARGARGPRGVGAHSCARRDRRGDQRGDDPGGALAPRRARAGRRAGHLALSPAGRPARGDRVRPAAHLAAGAAAPRVPGPRQLLRPWPR